MLHSTLIQDPLSTDTALVGFSNDEAQHKNNLSFTIKQRSEVLESYFDSMSYHTKMQVSCQGRAASSYCFV